MPLQAHLPPHLQGPTTIITRVAAGLSGAGVYRVDAAGQSFVLKIAAESESAADWTRTLRIQRLAAEAGLTPGVVHVDLARQHKHPGATGAETLETTLALGDLYQQMRAGALSLGTPEGQWAFGLALLKESLRL